MLLQANHGVKSEWADGSGILLFRYKHMLRQNLVRASPGDFVFVNAWNEWGEGAAIEPSVQWGRRWLEATQEAILEEAAGLVRQEDAL